MHETVNAYSINYLARADMIRCACEAHRRTNPDKYLSGKVRRFGALLLEAYEINRLYRSTDCLAVQIDKTDRDLCARYGWQPIQDWRAESLARVQSGLNPPVKLSLNIKGLDVT